MNKSFLPLYPWLADTQSDERRTQFGSSLLLKCSSDSQIKSLKCSLKFPPTSSVCTLTKAESDANNTEDCRAALPPRYEAPPEAIHSNTQSVFPLLSLPGSKCSLLFLFLFFFFPTKATVCCLTCGWQTVHINQDVCQYHPHTKTFLHQNANVLQARIFAGFLTSEADVLIQKRLTAGGLVLGWRMCWQEFTCWAQTLTLKEPAAGWSIQKTACGENALLEKGGCGRHLCTVVEEVLRYFS